ncbi:MAG: rhomboid family intramembrane serine protease [Pseudomonadota bacterium]
MHSDEPPEPLFNSLPPVVVLLALFFGAAEVIFQAGEAGLIGGPTAAGWRLTMAQSFGFYSEIARQMHDLGQYPWDGIKRFFTYPLVHRGPVDCAFRIVFILALGKWVGERTSNTHVALIFVSATVLTPLAATIVLDPAIVIIGGGPGTYGLVGALTWLLYTHRRAQGAQGREAFGIVIGLGVVIGLFAVLFGGSFWFEYLGGAIFGFLITAALVPVPGANWRWWHDRLRRR